MSSFETGRAKAGGLAGLAQTFYGNAKGNTTSALNKIGLLLSGRRDEIEPTHGMSAESVGGLAILPAMARKQIVDGMQKILKGQTKPKVIKKFTNRAENMGNELAFLPQNALDPISTISMTKKLKQTKTGAKDPIGRAIQEGGGKTRFELTHRIPSKKVVHEVGHAYDTAMVASTANTYRSKHAKLINEMTKIANRAADRYTDMQKAGGMADGIRYSAYANVNPREILARNINNLVDVAKRWQKKPLTQKQWRNIFKNAQETTLDLIQEKAPTLLRKGVEQTKRKYHLKGDKIVRRPVTENEKIDKIMGVFDSNAEKLKKSTKAGLPMKQKDLIKLIKKVPKDELKYVKIPRKAD